MSQRGHVTQIVYGPDSLLPYLDGASLCITATGMTAYESLCAGVPVILTNWSADHERTAIELEQRGVAINLGLWDKFKADELREAIRVSLLDRTYLAREQVKHTSDRCRALVLEPDASRLGHLLELDGERTCLASRRC